MYYLDASPPGRQDVGDGDVWLRTIDAGKAFVQLSEKAVCRWDAPEGHEPKQEHFSGHVYFSAPVGTVLFEAFFVAVAGALFARLAMHEHGHARIAFLRPSRSVFEKETLFRRADLLATNAHLTEQVKVLEAKLETLRGAPREYSLPHDEPVFKFLAHRPNQPPEVQEDDDAELVDVEALRAAIRAGVREGVREGLEPLAKATSAIESSMKRVIVLSQELERRRSK